MESYKDIFLAKELDKALTDVLLKTHEFFRNNNNLTKLRKDIAERKLRLIYRSILFCHVLKDKLVWFNAWTRKHTGKTELFFIKQSKSNSKKIINLFREEKTYARQGEVIS